MNLGRSTRWLLVMMGTVPFTTPFAMGCGQQADPPDCSQERCDAASTRAELLSSLEGHTDAVAEMFRNLADDDATISGDYNTLLTELGTIVGCDASTESSFVVLSNIGFIPKTVFARCADSPQLASRFFVAAPSATNGDMDSKILHLSGWDDEAKQYRHYATAPTDDGDGMHLNVEPTFCLGCHGGPEELTVWQPLMNEMTNPWSGWNAEPGFKSQLFDEFLDQEVAEGPIYSEMLSPARLDSASNLEPLVRAAIARTVGARVLTRNQEKDLGAALDLLRPMFCEETVNYVSEVHDSGEIRLDAIIDEGLRELLVELTPIQTSQTWTWAGESTVLLPQLEIDQEPVTLIATRGTISVELERALLARQVLSSEAVLRVRAIDWANPFGSGERCAVFRAGRERIEAGALDAQIAGLPADATTEELLPLFWDEILTDHPALTATDIEALGVAVDAHLMAVIGESSRATLAAARDVRGCAAQRVFQAAPIIPSLDCP